MKRVHVRVRVNGSGRESAIQALAGGVLGEVRKDATPIPHNGCDRPSGESVARTDSEQRNRTARSSSAVRRPQSQVGLHYHSSLPRGGLGQGMRAAGKTPFHT